MPGVCTQWAGLLSAFADGELDSGERHRVETHLSACEGCRAQLDDLRALSSGLSQQLGARVQQADFTGFADAVLRRVGPRQPGLFERLRVAWGEILAYHRAAVYSSLATAAVTLAVAVPLAYKFASSRAPSPELVLRDLKLDDPNVQPVVMNLGDGKTLIMLMQRPGTSVKEAAPLELDRKPPTGGDL